MKTDNIKGHLIDFGLGAVTGFINGIFGSGGGMVAVPLLTKKGMEQKQAHRNAVAVLLPVSAISAVLYVYKDIVSPLDALEYLPGGIAGAVAGTLIISKISPKLLKGVFGGFMVYAGVRLLLR